MFWLFTLQYSFKKVWLREQYVIETDWHSTHVSLQHSGFTYISAWTMSRRPNNTKSFATDDESIGPESAWTITFQLYSQQKNHRTVRFTKLFSTRKYEFSSVDENKFFKRSQNIYSKYYFVNWLSLLTVPQALQYIEALHLTK